MSKSIDDLRGEFDSAAAAGDAASFDALSYELSFRSTPKARALSERVSRAKSGATQRRQVTHKAKKSPVKKDAGRKPTPEQAHAIDLFSQGGSLKINAFAGAGKTSTLEMLANETARRGQYLAFNRDIVKEARTRFPSTVNCATTHGLAYRAIAGSFGGRSAKLTGPINANQLAEMLGLKTWRIDRDHILEPRNQGSLILDTIRQFAMSADLEPRVDHVPRRGVLRAASPATVEAVHDFAIRAAKHVWGRMQEKEDAIPLGHDGYLKLWALSKPNIDADFILMDEAQDTNAVVLDILRNQDAQMIYVGDKYQQIYEWRGAVNAMEAIHTENSAYLATSFRFGPTIADAATRLLRLLGERRPVHGNAAKASRIGPVPSPKAVLARSNASTITAVIQALDAGKRPHLVGGTDELERMLRGVTKLKANEPCDVPDFFGFQNWRQVVEFARSGEGDYLQTFVNLVESRGEKQLLWALGRTVEADKSNIVVSTAHKAKGREWASVRLMDDFLKNYPKQGAAGEKPAGPDPSELRLLYVAVTRAKEVIEIPDPLLKLMGLAAEQPAPASKSPRSTPTPPDAKATWKPPEDWQPPPFAESPQQKPEPPTITKAPPEQKGLFKRLFG